MNAPAILVRHRSLRWLLPVGVVLIAGLAVAGVFTANATSSPTTLPQTTPAALIAAVRAPATDGFSGTVLSHLSLGLPDLPAFGSSSDGTSMASLLTGSHTLQVWYGGRDRQRIALLGATDESDVFRSGRQLWRWSSSNRTAYHTVLPARPVEPLTPAPTASSDLAAATPESLARAALAAIEPSTRVTVQRHQRVADRPSYDLILQPRTAASRIGSVHIAVDGQTKVPLGVQIYPRGSATPAVDVSFTSIHFVTPSAQTFQFTPPSGASVHQLGRSVLAKSGPASHVGRSGAKATARFSVTGSGWTRVLGYDAGPKLKIEKSGLAHSLTRVSGTWGHGRLLESSLVSVLITDGGRIYAGAVGPDVLYSAARAN